MKLTNIKDVKDFLAVVNNCTGDVWLESVDGDKINLKSELSQYVAMAALISNRGYKLELFCSDTNDEAKFYELFTSNKDIEL